MFLAHLVPLAVLVIPVLSNPSVYGICQSKCANNLMTCYAAGGATFGTITTTANVIPELMVCNADYSNCQVDCIGTFTEWAENDLHDTRKPTKASNHLLVQE